MKSFHELFSLMIERRASHFHLVPGSPIMVRLGNTLTPLDGNMLTPADTARMANALLTDKQKKVFEDRLEVDFSYSIPGLSRFRINVFCQRGSIAMVIATNPPSPPTLEELGLPETVKNAATQVRSGLVIFCGPKGSGKSHTLAAILNHIVETRSVQVVTFENPITFLYKNRKGVVCQRERGTDFVDYKNAFDSLRHQACDILVVTDFEDYEVAKHVLNLSAGGNLVIVTAQAPSVQVMLDKILDMFPPHQRQQLLSLMSVGLNAVVSQTLLNKASGGGFVPAFEILTGVPSVRSLLREDKIAQLHAYMGSHGREYGMQTQEQALRTLLRKNLITKAEAMAKAVRQEELKKLLSMSV